MPRFRQVRDINVGVVGYGSAFNMGRRHLEDARETGMTPAAVAEIDPTRLEAAAADFPGIETYRSVAEMLRKSDVNLAVLITPHNTHARLGLQCLRAGRHVISEKPLTVTTTECDALIREAKKRKLLVSTYHNRHWDGCILDAVKYIRKQRVIGDVYRIDARIGNYGVPGDWWRSSKSISGGILYDWGVHFLEYALQLVDSEIVEVTGYARNGFWALETAWKADTNEDAASAVVRFKNGAWLTLSISSLESNPKPGWLEVTGTAGTYVFDGGTYEIIRRQGDREMVTKGKNMRSRWERYYRNIAAHLTAGEGLVITPEWSRRTIHILDLASRSAQLGRAIRTKYP